MSIVQNKQNFILGNIIKHMKALYTQASFDNNPKTLSFGSQIF